MNTKTVRGKYLHRGGSYNKTIIQRIEEAAKIKFAANPVEKIFFLLLCLTD
jgi:hypothetical protein